MLADRACIENTRQQGNQKIFHMTKETGDLKTWRRERDSEKYMREGHGWN